MFELGTSALVPIGTIALPIVLAVVSYFVVPYDLAWRLRGDTQAGDEEYASLAPYVGYEGDAPEEPEAEVDEPVAAPEPALGDPEAEPDEGVAEPAPDALPAGPDTPADAGGEPATAPPPRAGTPTGSPTGAGRDAIARAKGGKVRKCEPVPNPKITSLGEKKWRIERKMVDYYATHLRALDELGWVTKWKSEDGYYKGFKVGGLECGNDAWLAGLRNGDVVLSVNGTRVNSILEGIAAWAKNRKADVIVLEILRRGEIRSHTYRLY
jgi:hypothetical protein